MDSEGVAAKVADETTKPASQEDGESKAGMTDLLMLTDKSQLQALAMLLRNNEELMMSQAIKSETERVEYLKTVSDCYTRTMKLLDDSMAARITYERSGGTRSLVARDMDDYVVYGLNACLQNVRNCCVRLDAIDKLRAHYDALADAVAEPAANVEGLAAEASEYKAAMWQYCYNQRSASARAHSRAYSQALKLEGIDFAELVRRHQLRLGYGSKGEEFEDLDDTQKLEVYNSIIVESGRAGLPVRMFSSGRSAGGPKIAATTWAQAVSVFIMAAGNLAWDVFTTEHEVEAVVGAAVTKAVANVGAGVFACSLAGFVVGAIAGLIFIGVSGLLINLIIGSPRKVPDMSKLMFHTAVMPDGMALAYAVSH
uniref:Phytase n=1 Tax=Zea mays TaxID=4577 RepID=A0A804N5U7_MAIZE